MRGLVPVTSVNLQCAIGLRVEVGVVIRVQTNAIYGTPEDIRQGVGVVVCTRALCVQHQLAERVTQARQVVPNEVARQVEPVLLQGLQHHVRIRVAVDQTDVFKLGNRVTNAVVQDFRVNFREVREPRLREEDLRV
ncbi:hypothetical protein D3C85_740850 [compost metagenome]